MGQADGGNLQVHRANADAPALPAVKVGCGLFVEGKDGEFHQRLHAELEFGVALDLVPARPLAMDDLIERLRLSKGSASQGLKFLRNAGAVRMVYVAGDRRAHYEAVAELRNLSTRFRREQIVPHLDSGQARLERIAGMVKQLPAEERTRVNGRVAMLQSWGKRGRRAGSQRWTAR